MFDFEIKDGVLVWYKGEEETVVIPPEVTRIGVGAFKDSELVRVELHEGITRIHRKAFMRCCRLREIDIPDSVTRIDSNAFYGCAALESVHLPPRLDSIRIGTFGACASLKAIVLPETVRTIGPTAFENCKALEIVTLPKDLEEIDEAAFRRCKKLRLEALPARLKRIGAEAFSFCQIENLKLGGELEHLNVFMLPDAVKTIYAPENRIEDYLKGLNAPASELSTPYHCTLIGPGGCWSLDRKGETPCIRRDKQDYINN